MGLRTIEDRRQRLHREMLSKEAREGGIREGRWHAKHTAEPTQDGTLFKLLAHQPFYASKAAPLARPVTDSRGLHAWSAQSAPYLSEAHQLEPPAAAPSVEARPTHSSSDASGVAPGTKQHDMHAATLREAERIALRHGMRQLSAPGTLAGLVEVSRTSAEWQVALARRVSGPRGLWPH